MVLAELIGFEHFSAQNHQVRQDLGSGTYEIGQNGHVSTCPFWPDQGPARMSQFTRGLVVPRTGLQPVKSRPEREAISVFFYKVLEKYPFLYRNSFLNPGGLKI